MLFKFQLFLTLTACFVLLFQLVLYDNASSLLAVQQMPTVANIVARSENFHNKDNECSDPDLLIKVITFVRYESFSRLLRSLRAADYGPCSSVDLQITIDFSLNFEKYPKVSQEKVFEISSSFNWPFGRKIILRRIHSAGLRMNWLEGIYDVSSYDYVAIFEDDMEVSPQFYNFINYIHVSNYLNEDVASFCLCPSTILKPSAEFDCSSSEKGQIFYETQFTCSWGPVWKAQEYADMLNFVHDFSFEGEMPWLPLDEKYREHNKWMLEGKDLQSVWVLRYILQKRKRTLVYHLHCVTHFSDFFESDRSQRYFAINHKEIGENYHVHVALETDGGKLLVQSDATFDSFVAMWKGEGGQLGDPLILKMEEVEDWRKVGLDINPQPSLS